MNRSPFAEFLTLKSQPFGKLFPFGSSPRRPALFCLLIAAVLSMATDPCRAEEASERLAFVLGNGAYRESSLQFAGNDAAAVGQALQRLGFAVTVRQDLATAEMRQAIEVFADRARNAKVVLFYYAGHGIQTSDARNYLLPVDVNPNASETDIQKGVDLQSEVLNRLGSNLSSKTVIVILDACRLPARSKSGAVDIPLTSNYLGGLARMNVPSGTFLAFATAPGSRAVEDPRSKHGRFTRFLLDHLEQPGLTVEQVFKRTRTDVERDSENRQSPREESALRGDQEFRFIESGREIAKAPSNQMTVPSPEPSSAAAPVQTVAGKPATSENARLIESLRREPRDRRVHALQRLLANRSMILTPADVEEILRSFWINTRPRVLRILDDVMPRTMSMQDAEGFLYLLDRSDLIETLAAYTRGARFESASMDEAQVLGRTTVRAREHSICRVAEDGGGGNRSPFVSNVSAAQILDQISSGDASKMNRALHDLLQTNAVELAVADAVAVIMAFPPSMRGQILGELIERLPDRLTSDEFDSLHIAVSQPQELSGDLFLEISYRVDTDLPAKTRLRITQLAFANPTVVEIHSLRLAKFCPDTQSAVQHVEGLDIGSALILFVYLRQAALWPELSAEDRLQLIASLPPGDRRQAVSQMAQSPPHVVFTLTQLHQAIGDQVRPDVGLLSTIHVVRSVDSLRVPLTEEERQLFRRWFPGRDRDSILTEH